MGTGRNSCHFQQLFCYPSLLSKLGFETKRKSLTKTGQWNCQGKKTAGHQPDHFIRSILRSADPCVPAQLVSSALRPMTTVFATTRAPPVATVFVVSFIYSFATQLCETTLHDISHFHVHQMSGDLKEKLKTLRNYMEPAAPVMASIRAPFCLAVMVRTFSRQLMWPQTPRTTRKQQVWLG